MASGSARLARATPTARHVASGLKGRRRDRKAPRGGRFVVLCWVYLGFGENMLHLIYIYIYVRIYIIIYSYIIYMCVYYMLKKTIDNNL